MTMNLVQDEGVDVLVQVVRLLCRCTDLAFQAVPARGGELAVLGLGAQLLADQAMRLLSPVVEVDEPVTGYDDALQALWAAEAWTRRLPIEAYPPGTSQLIVGICDLIRDHPA